MKAVSFDMDGVLTDSEPLINAAAVAMFRERGLVVLPEDFIPFVGVDEVFLVEDTKLDWSVALRERV